MIASHRIALFTALIATSAPAATQAQTPATDSLLRRLERLERRTDSLEQRVASLEAVMTTEPMQARVAPSSAKWRVKTNWRGLRRGMTMAQVRALLGEPDRVTAGTVTYWNWGKLPNDAEAHFIESKLAGWSEPEWQDFTD